MACFFHNASDFNGAASQLEHCIIEKADTGLLCYFTTSPSITACEIRSNTVSGIYFDNCLPNTPALNNVTLSNNGGSGILLNASALPAYAGLTESGNGKSYWGIQGNYQSDYTLDIAGYAHTLEISDDLGITNNAVLTISPGSELKFADYAMFYVGIYHNWDGANNAGSLIAQGTALDPITFTSSNGLSNGWDGLRFYNASDFDTASSLLEYCTIEKADTGMRCYNTSTPQISNCVLQDNWNDGLYLQDCPENTPVFSAVDFLNNGRYGVNLNESPCLVQNSNIHNNLISGFHVDNTQATTIGDSTLFANSFHGNGEYDIENLGTADVHARYNFWCPGSGVSIADKIFDINDDPALGEVFHNPFLGSDQIYLSARIVNGDTVLLEWCTLQGATAYNIYASVDPYFTPAAGNLVNTQVETWYEIPLPAGDEMYYIVTAEVAARGARVGGICGRRE